MAKMVWTKLNLIPITLVLTGIFVVTCGSLQMVKAVPAPKRDPVTATAPSAANPANEAADLKASLAELKKDQEALKDALTSAKYDASSAQWLLSMVLLVGGLLTVAQGVFAFFSAQSYVKQADDALVKAKEALKAAETASNEVRVQSKQTIDHIESLVTDVKSKFPLFSDIEAARLEAFNELSKLTPALDIHQNLYAKSDSLTRQRVFAIEGFVAVQFLPPANRSAELVRNLRLLGKFYAGKFAIEGVQSDFDRAHYYFDLAQIKSRRDYVVLNDLGWLFATVCFPPDADLAKALFEESTRKNDRQQRAFFNLGTCLFDKADTGKLSKANDFLLTALGNSFWEDAPNQEMSAHISYNLACVASAMAGLAANAAMKDKLLDDSMKYIEGANAKYPLRAEILMPDLEQSGDLEILATSATHASRLQALIATLQQ